MTTEYQTPIYIFAIAEISGWFIEDCSLLSSDELARADRFKFKHLRQGFISSRCWLRTVLGTLVDRQPESLRFDYGKNGKPFIMEPNGGLEFNFSRSHDRCVCAVATGKKIGVDIEFNRQLDDMDLTAGTIFDQLDLVAWRNLPENRRRDAFFRAWTKKEAIVKANGAGISHGVKEINVGIDPAPAKTWNRMELAGKEYLYADVPLELDCPISVALEVESSEHLTRPEFHQTSRPIHDDNDSTSCLSSTQCILCEIELQS